MSVEEDGHVLHIYISFWKGACVPAAVVLETGARREQSAASGRLTCCPQLAPRAFFTVRARKKSPHGASAVRPVA